MFSFLNGTKDDIRDRTIYMPWIKFGVWEPKLEELNEKYDNLIDRILKFVEELGGKDPYDRSYNFEPLITFAVEKGIASNSMDFIYRHYVYSQLKDVEKVDIDKEELRNLVNEFHIIPELAETFLLI